MTIGRVDSTPNTISLMDLDQQLSLEVGGAPGAEIAALLLLGARDSRHQASAARQADEQRMVELEDEQVSQLYEQADATRSAGWARGMGLMVSGGMTAIGAGVALEQGGEAGKMTVQASSGSGNFAKGGLDFLASSYDFEANVSGADATAAGNDLKRVERHLQRLGEQQSEASELARTALQAASDLSRAETASDQATIFVRG